MALLTVWGVDGEPQSVQHYTWTFESMEYEELKKDPKIKSADRHMVKTRARQGWYQGCFSDSKWGGQRRSQKWDMLVECAPKMACQYAEVPNVLRSLLGIKERKHTNGKFSKEVGGLHQCPEPLSVALEVILDERMSLGEECTADFAANTLRTLLKVWNENVQNLKDIVQEAAGRELLQAQNESITDDMSLAEIERLTALTKAKLDTIVAELQPFAPSSEHASFRTATVRTWTDLAVRTLGVHRRLIGNFDQVWSVQFQHARRIVGRVPSLGAQKHKPTVQQALDSIKFALGMEVPIREAQPGSSAYLNPQGAMVPVDYARMARTTTTLSWADGSLGRAYVTIGKG
eukprot:s1070_g15.t1